MPEVEWTKRWELRCPAPCDGRCKFSITFKYTFNDEGQCRRFDLFLKKESPPAPPAPAQGPAPPACTADITNFEINVFYWDIGGPAVPPQFMRPASGVTDNPPSPPWRSPNVGEHTLEALIEALFIDIEFTLTCTCRGRVEERRVRAKTTYSQGDEPSFGSPAPDRP